MTKSGGISIVRLGLLAGLIGVLLVGAGIAAFYADQSSRRVPFEPPLYPGAEPWGTGTVQSNMRELFYRVPDVPAEEVAQFYQQKMVEHYGNNQEHCVRMPPAGEAPTSPNVPNFIPFQYTCVFDNSGFNTSQYTRVLIYPGSYHEDPFMNSQGQTVILYEQHWQP
ncbi:MAG TPA: hypothetical protein VK003_20605 [Oceanobacillus sp.]|nr:hypothetical protein [Oceanobacillus sp.]